jgi:glutaminyl-peptide cyclotransferase
MCALTACDRLDEYFTLSRPVEHLVPRIISVRPHDPNAFTEGLLLVDGLLYESTGRNGQSSLREVDPETGEVLRGVRLPDEYFGEGIALVGDRILQLTWLEGIGFIFDRDTFALVDTFPYSAEGWGMCYDGEHLYTSDGSPVITQRDAETLAPLATRTVLLEGQPVEEINELECVDESIYANVWHTDNILRIDKATGRVTAVIDAFSLLTPEQRSTLGREATLNGIAYDADAGTFLLTGKLWSWLFEVEFIPAPDSE